MASRFAGRARSFAHDFNIPRSFDSYAALLADGELDAIYNPLPNSLHAEWSIRAARAGKHVLCEKPLAPTAREASGVFDAARTQGVHVVEAFPYRAQPQTLKMRELIEEGAIGRVQFIRAHFTFCLDAAADIRLQRELAGGALMDVGCYSVSLVRMIAGQRPLARDRAGARWDASGVDRSLVATLEFPGGLLAQVASGFDTLERYALIVGTEGAIQTTFFNHPPRDRRQSCCSSRAEPAASPTRR